MQTGTPDFTLERFERQLPDLRQAIYRETLNIPAFKYFPGDFVSVSGLPEAARIDFDDCDWADFAIPGYWGGYDQVAWFRAGVLIPPEWRRDTHLRLRFRVGPRDGGKSTAETLLYANGRPLQGIDVWHEEAWLPPEMVEHGLVSVALRAWSGVYGPPERRCFRLAHLARIDAGAQRFVDLSTAVGRAIRELDEHDPYRVHLTRLLKAALGEIDFLSPGLPEYYDSLDSAGQRLEEAIHKTPLPELRPTVVGVGHSHIDMAWMWQRRHTREKAARTFSTALHLMRQYPDYFYSHSSPQLYQFIKEDQPGIYAAIQERAAAGQWEIMGGSWVEMDTNLPGGESLVRQLLFGQRFIRREFGRDCKVLWLPDSFGFSAALPQLMKQAGLDYFATAALHWSRFGRFPQDTFTWRGLDGSEVLVNLITTPGEEDDDSYTYIGRLEPHDVLLSWQHYRQKALNDELLLPFGWGDGGGGPTREMIESGRALAHMPGLPQVTPGQVEPYFERLAARLAQAAPGELPVWDGELYLESFRGVYTSQARIKRANRLAERLLHDLEWLSALADLRSRQARYPQAAINRAWETLLFNQFHDILPGTSIPAVMADSLADFETIQARGQELLAKAEQALVETLPADSGAQPGGLVIFNPLGWRRSGLVEIPWAAAWAGAGQVIDADGQKKLLVEVRDVPALGYQVRAPGELHNEGTGPHSADDALYISAERLENRYYRLEINAQGQLTALYDKVNRREVLAGPGNSLQIFEDRPLKGEAWDLDLHYQEKVRQVADLREVRVEESGPLRGVLRLEWAVGSSTITQRLTIYRNSPGIDFRTELDWREHQVLLKAAFPVTVRATQATYNIQFGAIERPTHWNTAHDLARFENPVHKWVDLSEGNYGVALLNDCKYGCDVKDNVLRLSLHRSPTDPDPEADQGRHVFTYRLLPHAGPWRAAADGMDVVREAYALNDPLWAAPLAGRGGSESAFSLVEADQDFAVIETVKKAEEADGQKQPSVDGVEDKAWIIRLYEAKQCRGPVALTFGLPIRRAAECNLLEQEARELAAEGQVVRLELRPYEVKTIKVWFR